MAPVELAKSDIDILAARLADELREVFDLDRFVSLGEAGERLHIGRSTAYAMVRDGRWDDQIGVPVQQVNGQKVVSLRLLTHFINQQQVAS